MWHFGIHIWDVNPMKLEPDYDEYHKVIWVPFCTFELVLTILGPDCFQCHQYTHPSPCQSIHNLTPSQNRQTHPIRPPHSHRNSRLHNWSRRRTMDSTNLPLPTSNRSNKCANSIWEPEMYTTTPGRDSLSLAGFSQYLHGHPDFTDS